MLNTKHRREHLPPAWVEGACRGIVFVALVGAGLVVIFGMAIVWVLAHG